MTRLLHLLARVSLVLALTLAGTSGVLAGAQSADIGTSAYAPGVVLVGFDPGASLPEAGLALQSMSGSLGDVMRRVGAVSAEPLFGGRAGKGLQSAGTSGVYRLRLADGADVMGAVISLSATEGVAYAEPDYIAQTLRTPNDPRYGDQWGTARIGAPAAWDVSTGSQETVIAIIDSGLDASHPDLAGRLWVNPGEIAGNGLDDDSNGKVDDVSGWDFLADSANLSDSTGHGTQVAGIIAATGNNGQGIAGLCWNCRIMVLKVTDSATANYSDIVEAVAYAAEKRADVINISLGGGSDSTTLRNAIEAAADTSVVVAGAGNDGSESPFYPAAYETALGVSGVDAADAKVPSSNYGPWVSLAAPGIDVLTTLSGGGYGPASGTSLAAAFVSGTAALLRSHHPDWSGPVARAQLLQTATVIDAANPGLAGKLGRGRVNAGAALTIAAVPKFTVTGHEIEGQDGAPLAVGAANSLVVGLRNDWLDAASVSATLSTADAGVTITKPSAGFGAIPYGDSVANAGDPFQVTIVAGAYGRTITFGLKLVADGKTSNVSFTVNTESVVATLPATISADTTLTNDRVWLAANSVKVNAGVTLTIQPGTTIKFAAGKYLLVEGTLIADGTPEQPITFTAAGDPVEPGGHWGGCHVSVCGGIIFGPEGNSASYDAHGQYLAGSIVRNCVLEHSEGGLVAWGAAPYVASNVLRYNIGSLGVALTSYVDIAVEGNRITHNFGGGYVVQVLAGHARVHGNLIAKNDGGVMVNCATGSHELIDNSLSGNRGTGCGTQYGLICVQGIHPPVMYGNNLVGNSAAFDIVMGTDAATSVETSAQGNFWGTTDEPAIQSRIYDSHHDFSAPTFTFTPFLTEPSLDAPPFLHNLTVSPDSPVGLEQAGFTLRFSAPMNQGVEPEVSFVSAKAGTSDYYGTLFPDADWGTVWAVALGRDGSTWIATESALLNVSGPRWAAYDYRAIGFPSECGPYVTGVDVDSDGVVWALFNNCLARHHGNSWELVPVEHPRNFSGIYIDDAGTKWLTTQWVGVQRYDGSRWASFDSSNSGLPSDGVNSIAFDGHGGTWFATEWGAARFDGTVWTVYDKYNSPLPDNQIKSVAVDASGAVWLATPGGLVRLSDGKWTTYDMFKDVLAMDALADGTVWFGGPGVVRRLEGSKWTTYASNLDCQFDLEADPAGNVWCAGVGAGVIWSNARRPVTDNGHWLDDRTWQATYDITSLVPRGEYVISVSGARGVDGMEIPADERFTFTVDYAGTVSDGTPPAAPSLYASGVAGDASAVYARWSAADPDSAITLYRYAVGTSDGATDIVSWTETTATSLSRSGLGLVAGRRYWLGVQARNSGGLWSGTTWLAFTAGEVSAGNVYLPLATK